MKRKKEKFLQWFSEFKSANGGYFTRPSDWHDKVESAHANIREFLGTDEKEIKVEVDPKNSQLFAPYEEIITFGRTIYNIIPEYFHEYGISESSFQYLSFCGSGRKGISWGKHINTWMEKRKIDPEKAIKVMTLVTKLGGVYAKTKVNKDTYYVTLGTNAYDFAMLGHLSCDRGGCFRQDGLNEIHKYILGQNPNTFVGYVSKKSLDGVIENTLENTIMRFWGIASKGYSRFNICNIYPRHPDDQGTVYRSISEAFKTLIGSDSEETPFRFRVRGIFFNKESPITYHSKSDEIGEETTVFELDSSGLNKFRKCHRCEKRYGSEDEAIENFTLVDYCCYCPSCLNEKMGTCEFSKEPTMQEMTTGIYNGKRINISQITAREHFRNVGGNYHYIGDLVNTGKSKYSLKKKEKVEAY